MARCTAEDAFPVNTSGSLHFGVHAIPSGFVSFVFPKCNFLSNDKSYFGACEIEVNKKNHQRNAFKNV